ncbi:MAG TPA: glycoside hydrolase family 15 protein [Candidatus Saccharimonadales bacterium]|nr:glycoside hydrolase family 15 protein [Candidatus Saccharimonadales bacterium]
MSRHVVLSNGHIFVGLDEHGLVHDFYYPYVGLDNLANARNSQHKIGVWVENQFRWVDDGSWQAQVDFEPDALISKISLHSDDLAITLNTTDFIDNEQNALLRRIEVVNHTDRDRDIRVFMHQVFQISRNGRADTAMYVPDEHYILDYKGRYCLLIAGQFIDGGAFDQYSVGNYGIEGKEGTFRDAEDGELTDNAVEHGGVDSVLRFSSTVKADATAAFAYWVVAGSSQQDVEKVHRAYKDMSFDDTLRRVRQHWDAWLGPAREVLNQIPEQYRMEVQKSILIVKAHCDDRGSILASGDSSIFNYGRDYYCYCWPRDAAYAIWPLIRLGLYDEAKQFFEFARDTMHPDGYLMHKYQPDRAIGSTWHPLVHGRRKELAIQEDETASVIFMLHEYYEQSNDKEFIEKLYDGFIARCANFMCEFIDDDTGLPHASYDLWEQKFLTSTYTVSTVIAGLLAAAKLAHALERASDAARWHRMATAIAAHLDRLFHHEGYFVKGVLLEEDHSLTVDASLDISSLYGPYMYAGLGLKDERLTSMAEQVKNRLFNTSPIGGVIRYEGDGYFLSKQQYKGNPWIVCSLWLAQYSLATGNRDLAVQLLEWAQARALPSGVLAEQFDPDDGLALGVAPLVWSHAEFVNTSLDLFVAEEESTSSEET